MGVVKAAMAIAQAGMQTHPWQQAFTNSLAWKKLASPAED